MYHEEREQGGRLQWRGSPDGEWRDVTYSELLAKLYEARRNQAFVPAYPPAQPVQPFNPWYPWSPYQPVWTTHGTVYQQ